MIWEIVQDLGMAEEFQKIYGMRFVGLQDPPMAVYDAYSYPDQEAPFPVEVIIDQQGIVRYWSTDYNPQAVIATISDLLGITSDVVPGIDEPKLSIRYDRLYPNPFVNGFDIRWTSPQGGWGLGIVDASGRRVRGFGTFHDAGLHRVRFDGLDRSGRRLPSGVYFVRLHRGAARVTQRVLKLE